VICPKCKGKSRVYNSRPTDDGTIRRNRECLKCKHRYATIEVSADIKKVVKFPKPQPVVKPKKKKKRRPAYTAFDRMTDDELMDALEKGLINPDDLE